MPCSTPTLPPSRWRRREYHHPPSRHLQPEPLLKAAKPPLHLHSHRLLLLTLLPLLHSLLPLPQMLPLPLPILPLPPVLPQPLLERPVLHSER
jgi:hypothetical protein